MRKHIYKILFLASAILGFGGYAFSQTINPISPFVFSTPIPTIAPTISSSSLRIPSLASTSTSNYVRTTASGTFYLGAGGSGGAGVGTLQGFTTSTYTGLFSYAGQTGYNAANAICVANFAGSHICSPDEILATISAGTITPANTAWIASGPPGYTANANDCLGWQSQTATDLGAYWLFATTTGGQGWLINCSNSKKISCCR